MWRCRWEIECEVCGKRRLIPYYQRPGGGMAGMRLPEGWRGDWCVYTLRHFCPQCADQAEPWIKEHSDARVS